MTRASWAPPTSIIGGGIMASRSRRALALAAIVATGTAGAVLVRTSGAEAATGCAVEYAVTSQWTGGFTASVAVRNLGDPVTSWTVTWSFAAGQQVSSAWNATVGQSGAQVTARNLGYNGTLASGASTSFGFQGTWTGSNPVPVAFTVNGASCTGGSSSSASSSSSRSASSSSRSASSSSASSGCPVTGHITYTLNRAANPTADQSAAYALITTAMDQALGVYNCYANVTKALSVSYDPSVSTADGNFNGSIRFGAKNTMQ